MKIITDIILAETEREASDIKRLGWRPRQHDIAVVRRSTATPAAYRLLFRAWRYAGFKASTIRELAHGKNRTRTRRRRRSPTAITALPLEQFWGAHQEIPATAGIVPDASGNTMETLK